MKQELGKKYRLIGRSLFQLQSGDYMHVAIVPLSVKSLGQAISWFESLEY